MPKEKAIRSLLGRKSSEKSRFSVGSLFNTRSKLLSTRKSFIKRNRKRVVRYSLLAGNLAVVIVALFVVTGNSGGNAAKYSALQSAEEAKQSNPLDTLTAMEVAANIALMTQMQETNAVLSESNVAWAKLNSAASISQETLAMPSQVISSDFKTKEDIAKYTVASGDTLAALASKFGVTSDSIRWSNGLSSTYLQPGKELVIPPVNGIVYTVKAGDTADKLAAAYNTKASLITSFNDAEITGLVAGDVILIPNGEVRQAAPRATITSLSYRSAYSRNAAFITRYTSYANPSPYARGWCTDWASYRAAQLGNPVGNWGDAIYWASGASAAGYYVGSTPNVGAIMYFRSNHVGVVEEVSADRTMIKFSDMNGLAGWGNAAKTNDWVPAGGWLYIYR